MHMPEELFQFHAYKWEIFLTKSNHLLQCSVLVVISQLFCMEGSEQLQKSMPCKLGALHFGKRPKGSSRLDKASDLTSSNNGVLGYRKSYFFLRHLFFFFPSGINIAKQYILSLAKGFTKDIQIIKTSHHVLSTFLESFLTADALYARHLLK